MVARQAQQSLELLNGELAKMGYPFKLAIVDIDDCELLEKNARYMTAETFQNLVSNIRQDGGLSSLPFCVKKGDKYKVLSGNHRVMAAQAAGQKQILILYTDKPLTRQEEISIQLSHNALVGQDDPVILKDLWDELADVELKYYAGLDDKLLEELEKVSLAPLSEVKLDFRTISFLFLPEEVERLDEVFEEAQCMAGNNDLRLASMNDFDRALDALAKTQSAYNVKNTATALMLILDIFERHKTDLTEGWCGKDGELKHKKWVPMDSVFGTDEVPAEAAMTIKRAVDKAMSQGDVSKKNMWQIIEYWAADYLGT